MDIKLDYKPRRVDYRALRDGRTIELMNFFHFDGAEMTLRHITLTGASTILSLYITLGSQNQTDRWVAKIIRPPE